MPLPHTANTIRRYLEGILAARAVRLALALGELGGSRGRDMELGCTCWGELREAGRGLKEGPCPGLRGPVDLGLGGMVEVEAQGELRE